MEVHGVDLRFEDVVAIQSTSAVYKMKHSSLGALALKCVVGCGGGSSLAHEAEVLGVLKGLPHVAEFIAFLPSVETAASILPRGATTVKSVLVERFYKAAAVHKLFFVFPRFEENVVRHVIAQLVTILDDIHARGVVYVDVKLPNVLLGGDGVVTLVDFGSAVILRSAASDASARYPVPAWFLNGTPHVRPPELCVPVSEGQQPLEVSDPFAVDRWALGVCAYELLCGQPLMGSFDVVAGAALASKGGDTSISWSGSEGVTSDARAFVEGLLCVDPADRLGAGDIPSSSWASIRQHPFLAAHDVATFVLPEAYEEEIDMQTLGL